MKLQIATPAALVVEVTDVVAIRAEDDSGSFGILPGHTEFLTVLATSILRWRENNRGEHYCAVRRGVLSVEGGRTVTVAAREAIVSDDADELERVVLARFREAAEDEQEARTESMKLQTMAIRRIIRHLRPDGSAVLGPPE